ncbi:MAG: TMEM165/GDT1 family protein [Clostridiales bacterium]|nr:TMEM165/GDT1 family protein [Clostridiales bacterium]
MVLFFTILLTMFIAEMGDKTQLLMIAMTSRYKLRDIIIGAGLSILALNAMAVGLGAIISTLIPTWLIKIIAALAFFYFAWTTLKKEGDEDEDTLKETSRHPILAVFGTFFIAELGDKTQLTAITFAANEGANQAISHAILIWLACSIGLFLADLVGMLIGYLLKSKTPDGFLDKLAFVIFAIFGFLTLEEGSALLLGSGASSWLIAIAAAILFALLCVFTWRHEHAAASDNS